MDGHVRTAADLLDRRKTRSFVVQQVYPALFDGLGYVLPPGSIPDGRGPQTQDVAETGYVLPPGSNPDGLVQKEPWAIYFVENPGPG